IARARIGESRPGPPLRGLPPGGPRGAPGPGATGRRRPPGPGRLSGAPLALGLAPSPITAALAGPFVPIDLWVPAHRANEAARIVRPLLPAPVAPGAASAAAKSVDQRPGSAAHDEPPGHPGRRTVGDLDLGDLGGRR